MARLSVRDVDDAIDAALKARAAANDRRSEAEHRKLLRASLDADARGREAFKAAAARLRARIGTAPANAERTEDSVRATRSRQ